MTIQELQTFIEETKKKKVLSSMVKLSEEVWELAEQVMKQRKRQRTEKWAFVLEEMWDEIADVIFAASMIACDVWIDLESAIERKKNKILDKFW